MINEIHDNINKKPINEKNLNKRNVYKINVIKINENNDKQDKKIIKSFRKMKSTTNSKNILDCSYRSKQGSIKSNNNEQIKKNLFVNAKKTNIRFHHNKSKIFREESISPKKRKFNYKSNNDNYILNLIKFTNQLFENVEHLKKSINYPNNDINESKFETNKLEKKTNKNKLLKIESKKKLKKQRSSENLTINLYKNNDIINNCDFERKKNEEEKEHKLINIKNDINNKSVANSSKQSSFFDDDKNNSNKNLELKNNNISNLNVGESLDKQAKDNVKIIDNIEILENKKNNNNIEKEKDRIIFYSNNNMENENDKKNIIINNNINLKLEKKNDNNNYINKNINKQINTNNLIINNNENLEKQITNKKIDNNDEIENQINDNNKVIDNEVIDKGKNDEFFKINNTEKNLKFFNIKKCFFCCGLSPEFNNQD